MAKRSDFAQKLLDDLRLRKERLASSSQSSNRSSSSMAIIDAYSYAKQNYRGSKDIRTNDIIGSRTGNARTKSNISNRSSFSGDSSRHIVPYNNARGQSSHQMGDLSMALAFALENGAKIQRADSSPRSTMLGFLQQMGMGSTDPSKMESRSSNARRRGSTAGQFPAFSPVQIEEISKGAQRLNQILRACSNGGVNLDQYSIQIGKELLKGAIDLENSLKMLVNLQEASNCMVKPQRKNQIKLLEEGEEDKDESSANVAEEWQLDRPRFSFDKALMQSSHSRSASFSSNAKNLSTLTEQKRQPCSSESSNKPEKARIPNVIAKLMGLEKLPEAENSTYSTKKDAGSKPKDEVVGTLRRATREISKIFGQKPKDASPPKKQKVAIEANPFVVNTSFVVVKERNLPSNVSFQVVIDGEKPTRSENAVAKKEKHQDMAKKNMEASHSLQQKRQAEKQSSSNPNKKLHNNHVEIQHQQPLMVRKLVSEDKNQGVKPVISQARKQKGSEVISKSSLKPNRDGTSLQQKPAHSNQEKLNKKSLKKSTNLVQSDEQSRERNSAELTMFKEAANNLNTDQSFSPRQSESEPRRQRARNVQAMDEKAVHVPILQRAKVPKARNKNESPRRIDEVVARRSGPLSNMTRSTRHQSSVIKEVKPIRLEKLRVPNEVKQPHLIKSISSEANDRMMDLEQKTSAVYTLKEDVRTRLREQPEQLSLLCQNMMPNDQLNQAPSCFDQELKCRVDVANELDGTKYGLSGTWDTILNAPPEPKHETKTHKPSEPTLTESENRLKQILIKSQLFLNTAEALFNLDIPINVLHSSSHNSNDDDDNVNHNEQKKLVLDCGYELMRRKGRRHELTLHPIYAKLSISFVQISTFDGLVRELNRDFEKLRMYGRKGREDCEVEVYLPAMQESDVYGREPDGNCLWDLGWGETVFAFVEVDEVVRDVEKYVLNGLLDEITGDLFLHVSLI